MNLARPRRSGVVRLALAGGVLTLGLVAVATSSAAYTDAANLNLGAQGIGFADRFDIGVVLPDGTVEQADGPGGVDWDVAGAEALVPGHEITTTVPVFNNTSRLGADTVFTLVARNGDGTVAAGIPNITPHLRFTAVVAGTTVFSDVTLADAHGSLAALAPRVQPTLAEGDTYVAGAAGSSRDLVLTIEYLDAPGVEQLNGGQSALSVRFDATSFKP